jgi:hypothetical protein
MSTLRVTNIEAKGDPSSPSVDEKIKLTNSTGDVVLEVDGKNVGSTIFVSSGIVTATSFSGSGTNLTGVSAQGLTGTPNITVTDITAVGNVSIAGTLTYEDVTNIDSVGIITARAGVDLNGFKIEEGKNDTSTGITGVTNCNFDDGQIFRFAAATSGNYFPNFRISASTTLDSKMDVGDVTAATMIVASSSHYCLNSIQIDGTEVGVTTSWVGGSAPSAANGSGYDIYSFTIMKTAATPTYHVIGNAIGAA